MSHARPRRLLVALVTAAAAVRGAHAQTLLPRVGAPRSALGIWLGASDTAGALVTAVAAASPGARAGLVAGERLVRGNGVSLRGDPADGDDLVVASAPARRWIRLVGRLAPGGDVELQVADRQGRRRVVHAQTAAPDARGAPWSRVDPVVGRVVGPRARAPQYGDRGVPLGAPDSAGRVTATWFRLARPRRSADTSPRPPRVESPAAYLAAQPPDTARARRAAEAARAPALGLVLAPTGTARDTLGLFVTGVVTDGPADSAGIAEGDRVAAIGDADVRAPRRGWADSAGGAARGARFTAELARLTPGARVALRVWRAGAGWRDAAMTAARADALYRAWPFAAALPGR